MMRPHPAAFDAATTGVAPVPYPRVIVGIDFSPASLAGCRWALTFVARGVDALFAHVVPFEHPSCFGSDDAPAPSRLDSLQHIAPALSGGLGGFAATLGIASARTAVRAGRPSVRLGKLAEEFAASLIVVGRRLDANRKRIGEANVVARLTRRARVPVLVVPEGVVAAPRCIVAAIDEGLGSVTVLRAAATVAATLNLPLIALHVLQPATGAYDRVVNARRRTIAPSAGDAPESAAGQLTLAVGDPAREIVAASMAHGGGLLVVGKRGADGSPVGSLGSVARELLAKSPLPVLAIDVAEAFRGSG